MSQKIEIKEPHRTLEMIADNDDRPLDAYQPIIQRLLTTASLLHLRVPMAKFEFTRAGSSSVWEYRYKLTASDGRTLTERWVFGPAPAPPEAEPLITTDSEPVPWRLSEFARQRPLRDALAECVLA